MCNLFPLNGKKLHTLSEEYFESGILKSGIWIVFEGYPSQFIATFFIRRATE
jgi:hypothetical protein